MLKKYTMEDTIDKIQSEALVIGSNDDQVAGSYEQAKIFYEALSSPKTYLEFSDAEGAQFPLSVRCSRYFLPNVYLTGLMKG